MYIYNDYPLIREHIQYIEEEKRGINALLDWVSEAEKFPVDFTGINLYRVIREDLEAIRGQMEGRIEILGEIIHEFAKVDDLTEDRIAEILHALNRIMDD